jgi:hypothetical protein
LWPVILASKPDFHKFNNVSMNGRGKVVYFPLTLTLSPIGGEGGGEGGSVNVPIFIKKSSP